MKLIIVRHGESDWTLTGRYAGATDVPLTANGRHQASLLPPLLEHVLHGQRPMVVSSPRLRALETATLALPEHDLVDTALMKDREDPREDLNEQVARGLLPAGDRL